jgi:signal transduction histidine kinase
MIELFQVYATVIGLTIAVVLAALWYKARAADRLNLELIGLNEQQRFDTIAFLEASWSLLARGSLRGLAWRLDWFGALCEGQGGLLEGRARQRTVEVGEMRATITFYQHEGRGEQRYFEETLIATFMLLLRMDMLIKAGTTDAALSHMARLNLFLQHDMKNIAQFIQLMADQVANVPPGREQQVLDYLRVATPLIRHRADRIVRTLTVGTEDDAAQSQPLRPLLAQMCELYQLGAQIEGDADVLVAGNALETVLDNIFRNYQDFRQREQLAALDVHIRISEEGGVVELVLQAPGTAPAATPQRWFEPFWSSNPNGLGIGLYQARHLMETQGGSLQVLQEADQPVQFQLRCRAATPA